MGGCTSKKNEMANSQISNGRMAVHMAHHPVRRPPPPRSTSYQPTTPSPGRKNGPAPYRFRDEYQTIEEVSEALHQAGLEGSNLIVGVDYTASNASQGMRTFQGRNLHDLNGPGPNPYQEVIEILGRTLSRFDEDNLIPAFGFGDITSKDRTVIPFSRSGPCNGFEDVLASYREVTSRVKLSGPTSFSPIIREAIKTIKATGYRDYHILIIIADGQVTQPEETKRAIIEASEWPLSIIMIGVGDGPWGSMTTFDDDIRGRRFDNFQFVDFHQVMKTSKNPVPAFALNALMEVPQQYNACKQLGILGGRI